MGQGWLLWLRYAAAVLPDRHQLCQRPRLRGGSMHRKSPSERALNWAQAPVLQYHPAAEAPSQAASA